MPGVPATGAQAATFIDSALRAWEAGTRTAFAVLRDGIVVGTTSYYEIDPGSLSTAIGYTFYTESAHGTVINPAGKFLLAARR